jgi:hypothetical protein
MQCTDYDEAILVVMRKPSISAGKMIHMRRAVKRNLNCPARQHISLNHRFCQYAIDSTRMEKQQADVEIKRHFYLSIRNISRLNISFWELNICSFPKRVRPKTKMYPVLAHCNCPVANDKEYISSYISLHMSHLPDLVYIYACKI